MVLPIRGCLDSVKRLTQGRLVHRAWVSAAFTDPSAGIVIPLKSQRWDARWRSTNSVKRFRQDQALYRSLWRLSGRRLICHCPLHEKCHGDVLIQEFPILILRRTTGPRKLETPADSRVLNYMSRLREERASEEGSSPDEGVPEKGSGHCGIGPPMMVGVGYTQRELCDGQSLASPGRWPPGSRVYPTSQK